MEMIVAFVLTLDLMYTWHGWYLLMFFVIENLGIVIAQVAIVSLWIQRFNVYKNGKWISILVIAIWMLNILFNWVEIIIPVIIITIIAILVPNKNNGKGNNKWSCFMI
jgi:hypothetical protein